MSKPVPKSADHVFVATLAMAISCRGAEALIKDCENPWVIDPSPSSPREPATNSPMVDEIEPDTDVPFKDPASIELELTVWLKAKLKLHNPNNIKKFILFMF